MVFVQDIPLLKENTIVWPDFAVNEDGVLVLLGTRISINYKIDNVSEIQ